MRLALLFPLLALAALLTAHPTRVCHARTQPLGTGALCCCRVAGGGSCCAEVVMCGGFVPGCFCQ